MAPLTADQNIGYFGNVTSTLDWCEMNYEVTRFIAEFWNTISNLAMIIPPIFSYLITLKHGMKIEKRFLLSYLSILAVGFGSWAFHMTLLYEFQLFDEIPMVWGSLLLVYVLTAIIFPKWDNSLFLIMGLVIYGIFVTLTYLLFIYPIIFQVSYGILVVIVLLMDFYISQKRPCDPKLFYLSAFLYYTGFVIWNIDNRFCAELTQFRNSLPFFLRPFTQLHAIWHILAGYGSYIHIFFCAQARSLQKKYKVKWVWKYIGFYLVLDEYDKDEEYLNNIKTQENSKSK